MTTILASELQGYGLRQYGFVHVTGLSMRNFEKGALTTKCLLADREDCGHYSDYYGTSFIVTTNGEIWVHQIVHNDPAPKNLPYLELVPTLCPHGEGEPIISDPWRINYLSTFDVLSRLSDPTWNRKNGDFPLVRTTAWRG